MIIYFENLILFLIILVDSRIDGAAHIGIILDQDRNSRPRILSGLLRPPISLPLATPLPHP